MTKQSKRGQQAPHMMTKRQLARWERERQLNRRLIIGVSTAVALALLVLVGGIVWDRLIQPSRTVAKIGGTEISRGDYILFREMSLVQKISNAQSQINQYQNFLSQFGGGQDGQDFSQQLQSQITQLQSEVDIALPQLREVRKADIDYAALDQMIEEEVILQGTSGTTMTVDDADVDRQLATNYAALLPTPEPTPGPTLTATITGTLSATPTTAVTSTGSVTGTAIVTGTPLPSPTSTITPTATATLEAGKAHDDTETALLTYYDQIKQSIEAQDTQISIHFSKEEFLAFMRRQARVDLLRTKIKESAVKEGPLVPHARVQHTLIKATAPETATAEMKEQAFADAKLKIDAIYTRVITDGEDFTKVVSDTTEDEGSKANDGIYDWTPTSQWVPEFKLAAETQPIGEIGKPIRTEFGWHILKVLEREDRPDNSKLEELRTTALTDWITKKKSEIGVQRFPEPTPVPTVPPEPTLPPLETPTGGAGEPTPPAATATVGTAAPTATNAP